MPGVLSLPSSLAGERHWLEVLITAIVAAPVAFFAGHALVTWKAKRSLPPGPWPYPVVGNFPHLLTGKGFHRTLQDLHKQYGPILTLWYASKLTIVLGTPRLVQQTHREQGEKFLHRTLTDFAKLSLKADEEGGKNVALAGGKYWVKARNVFVYELMRKRFLENVCIGKIMEEIWSTMDAIKTLDGAPFDPHEHLMRLSANIVYRLTYGIRFKSCDIGKENTDWGQLSEIIVSIMRLGGQNVKANYSPFLKMIENLTPSGRALNKKRVETVNRRDAILKRLLEEHKSTLVEDQPRDFLDVLLTRQEKDGFSDTEVMYIAWEFITAGTDTTSATMHWLTLLLANHPEVQRKAQQEIDSVCHGRPVTIDDQDRMPYVNACVKECMRWMPAVPLMVPYRANKDALVEVDGREYAIKEGTQVIVNGFNMHRDPDLWVEPDKFDPERFMVGPDSNIELRGADAPNEVHHLKFMPLGTGRRACAGYLLAKLELFLQGATLMQCFDWRPAVGDKVPLKEIFGIAVCAGHTDVTATWREASGIDIAAAVTGFGAQA